MHDTFASARPETGTPRWAEGMPLLLPGGPPARIARAVTRLRRADRADALAEARGVLASRDFPCGTERVLAEVIVARFLLGEK